MFHVVGMDERGKIVIRKRISRMQLLSFAANLPICKIAMEASCGAHNLGRILTGYGHQVRLIPAQFVRPFVKSNKNDYVDAEAIAEAVQRPTMRFVPIKTEDQLDLQALHRVRDRLVSRPNWSDQPASGIPSGTRNHAPPGPELPAQSNTFDPRRRRTAVLAADVLNRSSALRRMGQS